MSDTYTAKSEPLFEDHNVGDLVHLSFMRNERTHYECFVVTSNAPRLNLSLEIAEPGQWCGTTSNVSTTYVGPVRVVNALERYHSYEVEILLPDHSLV